MPVDRKGDLPLHLELKDRDGLYQYEQLDVVTCLVKQWPESVTKRNTAGLLPLQLATEGRFYNTERRKAVLFQLIDQHFPLHFVCQHYEYLTWKVFECVLQYRPEAVTQTELLHKQMTRAPYRGRLRVFVQTSCH
mmetsp:Transcript_12108/g.20098  ORF Transcript_12108/g.20098 Transcript_12108/m.20098 type:complete len:135 (+) Transcript_12108:919-1323(+)